MSAPTLTNRSTYSALRRNANLILPILCGVLLIAPEAAQAQFVPGINAATAAREQRRQDERINALRQQQERTADVRLALPQEDTTSRLAEESPCFVINRMVLNGDGGKDFSWLLNAATGPQGDDSPIGRCLGGQGINLLLKRLQNALIAEGYITTRIGAEAQDLKSGELHFVITPGRVQSISHATDSVPSSLATAFPVVSGELLNLRDIEQGMENIKYPPSADAKIGIIPGDNEGFSQLVVSRQQNFPVRMTLSADDGGTKATGKYQGSATIAWDNPTGFNDLFYFTLNHDLKRGGGRGTDGGVVHYSIPFGYWLASATYDRGSNFQTIAGANQNYIYKGRNGNAEIKLSRVVHRDGTSKATVALGVFQRTARNFIDDTEVEVQRRRTGGWLSNLTYRQFIGAATLDAGITYKRGTGAFGAISAPEELFGEGTSRFEIFTADLGYNLPFQLNDSVWHYRANARIQFDRTPLAVPERFVIGGRYSVRGFDGETVLAAERGWYLRNEIATSIIPGLEVYGGLDIGAVSGPSADLLVGKRLAGAVLGVRGAYRVLRYEVFVGTPIYKPNGFQAASTTAGFSLSAGF
jgi:hemolysin activation/secretion protein